MKITQARDARGRGAPRLITRAGAGLAVATILAVALAGGRPIAQTGMLIQLGAATLPLGASFDLNAVSSSGGALSGVAWSSTATAVATVSSSGLVKAVAPGFATVTAKSSSLTATISITVLKADGSMPPAPQPEPEPEPEPPTVTAAIWISPAELAKRPTSGTAWSNVLTAAGKTCTTPNLSNQDDPANVCVLAKALVYARTGDLKMQLGVVDAIWDIVSVGTYDGRALSLGRELAAYVIAADLINLKAYDASLDFHFRQKLAELRTTPTTSGPGNLVECHELRPNNWGAHCGASRAAIAAYLGDTAELARVAKIFKGYIGDRASYAGFKYGELSWQCDASRPVGLNAKGCTKNGYSIDGVMPDDQRRAGSFKWPPPQENYAYEALQGLLVQAVILRRAGYDTFNWQDAALRRAFSWLHTQAKFPTEGDDVWQAHLVNHFYGTSFPAASPARAGKNMGWTDWTHGR